MTLQITIDGRLLQVEAGRTVLQAARENGIDIPTLCDYPGLTSHGSCRMCIVEIEGRQNTPTACTTLVENGMIVQTESPNIQALRKDLFKLLVSEHPGACLFCPEKSHCDECMVTLRKAGVTTGCRSCSKDGQCELQTLAERLHVEEGGYPVRYRMLPIEKGDPFFDRDYNLCVLCERCVRVCEDNHFSSVVTLTSRGTDTLVGTPFGQSLLQAGCSFCGACVEVCVTGSLSEKTSKWSGVPESEISTTCPLCSAGCQIRLLVKNGMVIGSLPDHANGTDMLCVKGRFGIAELVNHSTRLERPVVVEQEHTVHAKWDEAISIAAQKIQACPPEKYGMIISADCTNETLYIAKKFVRDVIRSKSLYMPSAAAYGGALPIIQRLYRSSKPLSALSEADTILCLGINGKYAQSIVERELLHAKRAGARLITLDTMHRIRNSADEWLQPASGEEVDLLEMLLEIARGKDSMPQLWPIPPQARHSARFLMEAKRPIILVGSSILTHPENAVLLKMIEQLMPLINASVILLPDPVNLNGAIQMGITTPISLKSLQDLDVVHVVGETIPSDLPDRPFVLYQNMYPPVHKFSSGLILPVTTFTEEDGTFIDHASRLQSTHQAVQASGNALPSWQILCRIAQKLDIPGFDYENIAQIQAEMDVQKLAASAEPVPEWIQPEGFEYPSGRIDDHLYMGFPLRTWVAGFRVLYPEPVTNNA